MSPTVEETLAREAEQRPRAFLFGILAGVLTLAGNVLLAVLFRNGPGEEDGFVSLSEALGTRLGGGEPSEQSLFARQTDYYGDNVLAFGLATVLTATAVALAGLTLVFLYRATVARLPDAGRLPIIATVVGTVSYVIGHLVRDFATWIGAAGFDGESDRSAEAARDVLGSSVVLTGSLFELIGLFALGIAFVLVSLTAMRAGLLTRFLGILGIIVGVLTVFQLDQPQIVRAFWLIAIGLVISGRQTFLTRNGPPPAWLTGRHEPWPSQQQVRERREAEAGRAPARSGADAPGAGAESAGEQQQRRKRKRRR